MTSADPSVQRVREASRQTVRELGFLGGRYEETGHTHSQCHALQELDRRGTTTMGDLAELLRLERSTLSRAIAPLVEQGEVEVVPDPDDQRSKPLRITRRGRRQVLHIHAAADRRVRGALELLSEAERRTVVEGLELYAEALNRSRRSGEVELRRIRKRDEPAMARIIRDVMTEFGATGTGYSIEDPEVQAMYDAYLGPRAAYFVALRAEKVVGGAGVAPLEGGDDDVCELRKMYVLPEVRGLAVGRRLLEACLDAARERGFRRCYLETLAHMSRAQRLYEAFGFARLDAPLGATGHFKCNAWYARELAPA